MSLSVLQRATGIKTEPFPHLVISPCLPEPLYQRLAAERLPDIACVRGARGNNRRHDLSASVTLLPDFPISPLWRSFIEHHTSQTFFGEVAALFGLKAARAGVRFRDDTPIQMDCQLGVNTPVLEESRVRGPHVDNPIELIGGLFYMRHPADDSVGGDLLLQRIVNPNAKFIGKAELRDEDVATVAVVPYAANTLVLFRNSAASIHAVTPRSVTRHYRRLVNFAIETRGVPLFELPR